MTSPPQWLVTLANEVAAQIQPMEPMGPIGCHVHRGPVSWEVTVFASLTEVVSGPHDGRLFGSRFEVNLKKLLEVFSDISAMHWQCQGVGPEDELGAHLSIEGHYGNELVWVRIPAISPERFGPGRKMLVSQRRWQEVW